MSHRIFAGRSVVLILALACLTAPAAADTIVRFNTALGWFDVELFNDTNPITVANFLNYVADGDYDNSWFHRLVPGFVLQGGMIAYDPVAEPNQPFWYVPTDPQIEDEVRGSNLRGTIAMAKAGPNTATSQFFFNLSDNTDLDNPANSGGFATFGQVLRDGMTVVDGLASQGRWDVSLVFGYDSDNPNSPFRTVPLIEHSDDTAFEPYLEMIYTVTIVGDVNGDGLCDDNDVDPFVTSLTDPAAFAAAFPTLDMGVMSDINGDGAIDGEDIKPFIFSVYGEDWQPQAPPDNNPVPEPATLALLTIGGVAVISRRRRANA